jgi:hypothetical protein
MTTEMQELAEKVLHNAGIKTLEMETFSKDLPVYMTEHGKYRYPLRTMQIGQHFYVPCRCGQPITKLQSSLNSSVCYIAKETGRRFTQKRMYGRGIRVWRLL